MTATVDNLWKSPERLCITAGGGEPVPNQGQSARTTLNLIRSVIGHADGHEVAAVSKIRAVLDAAGEAV